MIWFWRRRSNLWSSQYRDRVPDVESSFHSLNCVDFNRSRTGHKWRTINNPIPGGIISIVVCLLLLLPCLVTQETRTVSLLMNRDIHRSLSGDRWRDFMNILSRTLDTRDCTYATWCSGVSKYSLVENVSVNFTRLIKFNSDLSRSNFKVIVLFHPKSKLDKMTNKIDRKKKCEVCNISWNHLIFYSA